MQCFKCGAILSDNASFCTNCGAKLNGNEQPAESFPHTPTEQQTPPIQPEQPQQYYQSQQSWQPIPTQQTPPPIPPQQQIPTQQFAQPMYQASVIPQQPVIVKPKKNLALPIVCISVAVLAIAALVVVIILNMGGKNDGDSNKEGSTTRDYNSIITTIPEIKPSVTTEAPQTAASDSPTQTAPPAASETDLIRGTISGNTFKSELFKIQAEIGDDWVFGSDAEVAEINGMTGSSAADFENAIKNNSVFNAVYARKSTGSNFIISVPNPDILGSITISEKAYIDAIFEGLKSMDGNATVSTVTFAGKTHQTIRLTNSSMGITFRQCLVFIKGEQHMCMITFTCFTDDEIDEVMSWFTSLD